MEQDKIIQALHYCYDDGESCSLSPYQSVKSCNDTLGAETLALVKDLIEKNSKHTENVKFVLNGCDISFVAEAPADITLEQLLKQCDRIKPDWCACGICSAEKAGLQNSPTEIFIDYESVKKANDDVSCTIE